MLRASAPLIGTLGLSGKGRRVIEYFRKAMPVLEEVTQQLGRYLPPPEFIPDDHFPRYRHAEQSNGLAAYLKAVRIVSALNACLSLVEHGFIQELGVLFRTIDEFLEDIVFLMAPQPDGRPTEAQTRFLDDFYQEEFETPGSPLGSSQKRDRVPRKKVHAALAKTSSNFLNPSDGAEVHRTLSQAMSGYVHGAYPHIMDLWDVDQRLFRTDGMYGTPIHESAISTSCHYYYRGIQALLLLSQVFSAEELIQRLQVLRIDFERQTGLVKSADIETLIRAAKNGK